MGPLQVAYKETIADESVLQSTDFDKIIGGAKNHVEITLAIKPSTNIKKAKLKVIVTKENNLSKIRPDRLRAVELGIHSALQHGPLLNFPVIGVDIELHWFKTTYDTTPAVIASAATQCITEALKKGSICLLEPLMKLEITVPASYGPRVVSDLSARRAQLGDFSERSSVRVVEALTPLSELLNYSSTLRTISSGTATLSMEFHEYCRMSDSEQKRAIERVTGFSA